MTIAPKKIDTTRPDVVRLSWRYMQVTMFAAWVWQIRPGEHPITGVEVGKHVEAVEPPAVVVIHQVVGACDVVRQTSGVVADPVTEAGVVVIVAVVVGAAVVCIVEGAAELSVDGVGVSVVVGASVVVAAAEVAGSSVVLD